MSPVPYRDLYGIPEDERIRQIGEHVGRGEVLGVILEADQPDKVARYIQKVTERFPEAEHLDTTPGPTPLVVTVRFGPKGSNRALGLRRDPFGILPGGLLNREPL